MGVGGKVLDTQTNCSKSYCMKKTRFTIDLDENFDSTLTGLAASKGTTKAEIIKRALATYSFISSQFPSGTANKVAITGPDDKVLKEIILP